MRPSFGQLLGREVKKLASLGGVVATIVHIAAYVIAMTTCLFSRDYCPYRVPSTLLEALTPAWRMTLAVIQFSSFGAILGVTWATWRFVRSSG